MFCEVQPGKHFYCHRILWVGLEGTAGSARPPYKIKYTIHNNEADKQEKWCYEEQVYGKLSKLTHDRVTSWRPASATWPSAPWHLIHVAK